MMGMEEKESKNIFVSPGGNNCTLLIVDSDPQNLMYVQMLLQRFDIQANTAQSAREAFERAISTIPSLIITAIGLKDMSGLNLMKLLKRSAKTSNIPFITMRRKEDAVSEQHCFNAGAIDCLNKPISAELLYRALQGVIEDRPRATMQFGRSSL